MQQFGGKDSKRHFTVVMGGKEHGLYVSSTPSSAARKAVTKLCATNKSKKVEFSIREITQGSKKKTYGPYKGHIEKIKEPIELKGRVIRYKPIAKLSSKKGVQKGGLKYDYKKFRDSEYNAIYHKLESDQNYLTTEEKDDLNFISPRGDNFFRNATTYLWILTPDGFTEFDHRSSSYYDEEQRYYYCILKISKNLSLAKSIYIAFRVVIKKEKLETPEIILLQLPETLPTNGRILSSGKYYVYSKDVCELLFLAKGAGKEAFFQNLFRVNSVAPGQSGFNNRSRLIDELIRLVKKRNTTQNEEFKDLQKYFQEKSLNHGYPVASAPPLNNGNLGSAAA